MIGANDITFRTATADDFEVLVSLRLRTMRESLERIGRFDPERARERFQAGFQPEHMRLVYVGEAFVGCVTVRSEAAGSWVEHFYIEPDHQGRGLGAATLKLITDDADASGTPLRLAVLKQSDAGRFYRRHGFIETGEEDWDVFYERAPRRD